MSEAITDSLDFAPAASAEEEGEQFLRLHLLPNTTVLLPVQQLTEVLTLSIAQIVPMPQMPAWVMGVYNWRGEILWMVDLGHLCGLSPWYQQSGSAYSAIVLEVFEAGRPARTLGLLVDRVEEMEWCDPDQIQPVSSPPDSPLATLLRGYWWKPNGDTLAVLDGSAIVAAMP